ncbi:MAG: type 1 glutamine amidotransferase [Candidatus Paceibacterota bacterium]
MLTKVLVIQFRINDSLLEREQNCINRSIGKICQVDYVSALKTDVDWQYPETVVGHYDGFILGGSGDLDFDGARAENDPARHLSYEVLGRLRPLFQYIFDHDRPTLGICFGHQILGAFAGAQVHCDACQKKICSHEVKFLVDKQDYFLFSDLPDSFYAHYGHKDVLDRVPAGATLLMTGGESCQVSALQYKQNIYTVQFHPELNYTDMIDRIKNSPGYLPEGAIVEEIFKDEPHSNTILENFGKLVALSKKRD